jgi:hypothetical protein
MLNEESHVNSGAKNTMMGRYENKNSIDQNSEEDKNFLDVLQITGVRSPVCQIPTVTTLTPN